MIRTVDGSAMIYNENISTIWLEVSSKNTLISSFEKNNGVQKWCLSEQDSQSVIEICDSSADSVNRGLIMAGQCIYIETRMIK